MVVVEPTKPYDMELGAELEVVRGAQGSYPGTPLQCKVVHRSKASLSLKRGGVGTRIYAINTSDKERMRMLLDPTSLQRPTWQNQGMEHAAQGSQHPCHQGRGEVLALAK